MCRDCWVLEQNRRKLAAANSCVQCGHRPIAPLATICGKCNNANRASAAAHCLDCGAQLLVNTTKRCRPCHLKWMSSEVAVVRFARARATGKAGARRSLSEDQAGELLDRLGLAYRRAVPYSRWVLDFVLDEVKTVIEVHGTYWHDLEKNSARDLRKRQALEAEGWRVLFWRTDARHLWWCDFVPAR